jgi:hypothetical protein
MSLRQASLLPGQLNVRYPGSIVTPSRGENGPLIVGLSELCSAWLGPNATARNHIAEALLAVRTASRLDSGSEPVISSTDPSISLKHQTTNCTSRFDTHSFVKMFHSSLF